MPAQVLGEISPIPRPDQSCFCGLPFGWITAMCWLPPCILENQHQPQLVGPGLVAREWEGWDWGGTELDWLTLWSVGRCIAPTIRWLTLAGIHSWSHRLLQRLPAVPQVQQERAGAASSTSPAQSWCQSVGPEPQRWLEIVLPMLTAIPSPHPLDEEDPGLRLRIESHRDILHPQPSFARKMAFWMQKSGNVPKEVNALRLTICLTYTLIYASTSSISHKASP